MLDTVPKAFYQIATSQGYFTKWNNSKCAISQAASSKLCPSRRVRPLLQTVAPHMALPNLRVVAIW